MLHFFSSSIMTKIIINKNFAGVIKLHSHDNSISSSAYIKFYLLKDV